MLQYESGYEIENVGDISTFLKMHPEALDFKAYVSYADSLYAITDVYFDNEEAYIGSLETQGKGSDTTVADFLEMIEGLPDALQVICAVPDNLDKNLDCQLEEPKNAQDVRISQLGYIIVSAKL